MKAATGILLALAASASLAQEQEIQRALIQRDQQSAEFAAQLRGSQERAALEILHARQLLEVTLPTNHPAPDQRGRMAQERELFFAPPVVRIKLVEAALPLPGGPRHGVDPIPAQGTLH